MKSTESCAPRFVNSHSRSRPAGFLEDDGSRLRQSDLVQARAALEFGKRIAVFLEDSSHQLILVAQLRRLRVEAVAKPIRHAQLKKLLRRSGFRKFQNRGANSRQIGRFTRQ